MLPHNAHGTANTLIPSSATGTLVQHTVNRSGSGSPHHQPPSYTIAALTPTTSMSGSSPGSASHKRKASELDDDAAAGPPAGHLHALPSFIAPSYSVHSQQSLVDSPLGSTAPSNHTPEGSGSGPSSRSMTLDSAHSKPATSLPHINPSQPQVTGHHGLQSNTGGNKRIKTARACDSCRRKKIRCDVIEDGTAPGDPNNGNNGLTCSHCRQYGFECTFFLPITETRFKKKREREREAELAAKAAAAGTSLTGAATMLGRPGAAMFPGSSALGSPYGVSGGMPAPAGVLYRSASGNFYGSNAILGPGASGAGLPSTLARHIPPVMSSSLGGAPGLIPGMSGAPVGATSGRYPSYDSVPSMNAVPNGARLSTQEWPPPLPSSATGGAPVLPAAQAVNIRPSWRESDSLLGKLAQGGPSSGYGGAPRRNTVSAPRPPLHRKTSAGQRADSGGGGGSVQQPPDARVLGPTSIAYIVHSQPFVPGAAIEAHDIKHHQTFEVGASGDGIIKFNRPPRRTSAASADDDEVEEVSAATAVALAAMANAGASAGAAAATADGSYAGSVAGAVAAVDGDPQAQHTPGGHGDGDTTKSTPADMNKVKLERGSISTTPTGGAAAPSPSVGAGMARVRLAADVAEKLANVYFSRIANMFPVVTKAEFLHLSPPPPLLLYAVCGIAALSRDVPREVLLCVKTCLSSIFRDADVLSTSKSVTVRALLVLSLHSDVHGSTAMQSGARCWNRTGCAVRMAQDLGLHRDATGRDDEDDDQFFLEQKRRIWGCCVTADRILSISLGHPLAIDLTDCDVRLPSPFEVKRWADDPSADPSTDRPFAFNTEMLKLSILFGRVMKTIYSPTGLMKTTDEEISGLLGDIDTWQECLPPELRFTGNESSPNAGEFESAALCVMATWMYAHPPAFATCAGILHVAFACVQMLFWRVFLRISYICPAHLKFSLTIERMTLLIKWSREAILWVDRNDFYLDTLQLVSYSLVFCATVQYHAWVRRGETEALEVLKTCRDCVNRFRRPGGEDREDLSMRAKTASVITMLYEAASGVYANSPCGSHLNPTAGVLNRRAVETLRGIVFRADPGRPGGGVYVAANQAHVLEDLPTGTIIHETGSNSGAPGEANASVNKSSGPDKPEDPVGGASLGPAGPWTQNADGSMLWSGAMGMDGPRSFQIPPEAGMGRALTAHISENGPIQLELQQPPLFPPQTSSGFSTLNGGPFVSSGGGDGGVPDGDPHSSRQQTLNAHDQGGQQQAQQQQDAPPFGMSGGSAGDMTFFNNAINVNPLLNEIHWPAQNIMIAGGAEFDIMGAGGSGAGGMSSIPAGAVQMQGVGPAAGTSGAGDGSTASVVANGGLSTSSSSGAMGAPLPTGGDLNGYGSMGPSMGSSTAPTSAQSAAFNFNAGGDTMGGGLDAGNGGVAAPNGNPMTSFDPSVLDGLPVSGLDFGAWDNFFSRFMFANGDGMGGGGGGGGDGGGGLGSNVPNAAAAWAGGHNGMNGSR
ncbi:hypothetical protein V8E36_007616 [Tilletia maclaganii]